MNTLLVLTILSTTKTSPKICHRCHYAIERKHKFNRSEMNVLIGKASRHTHIKLSRSDYTNLYKLTYRESEWDSWARNKRSSAAGLCQLLRSTYKAMDYPYYPSCPVCQLSAGLKYIKTRHRTPTRAMHYSNSRGYY